MTITLDLKPEIEQGLRAQAQAQGVSLDEFLQNVMTQATRKASAAPAAPRLPIWDAIADSMKDVPPEDLAALPADGASQIDHYVYGLPKRDR